jgi:PAS domain S-box-containing protein
MNERAAESATFQARYLSALTGYVGREAQEADLMSALELGKVALAEGYSLLDLLTTHHTLVGSLIAQSSNPDVQRRLTAANDFLAQAAAPFEMAHRAWHELADRLRLLNVDLEKRVAERTAAHRASEERWRRLFEVSAAGMALANLDGVFIAANPAFQKMLGRTEDEIKGRSVVDIAPADDRPGTSKVLAEFKAGLRQDYHVENYYLRSDGDKIWASTTISLVPGSESTGPFLQAVYLDLSELEFALDALRASEVRWRTVFQDAPVGIVTLDLDLRYTGANPAFQRMLGYSEDELRSLTVIDITYEEDREATRRLIDEAIAGERRSYEVEKRFLRKDGEIIWVNANTSLIPATESTPAFFAGVAVGVTDRRRAEEALRQAQAEVARVAQLTTMGQLAASIAHEISQPLMAILGSAETCVIWLAKDKPNLLEVREAADRIVKNGHRAAEIMKSIRSLAMKSSVQMDRLSVNSAIRETLVLVAGELRRDNIVLRTVLSSDVGDVWADRVQLQQVVLNLVMNGIEAMRNSAPPHVLRVRTCVHGRAEILVAVEDSGIGIDAEQADRIFDAFFTTKSEGMGMGLSICRSIVEAHGGRLWASPNTGRGAIFSFTLPAPVDAAREVVAGD